MDANRGNEVEVRLAANLVCRQLNIEIIPLLYYNAPMDFEYDPEKSLADLAKHGIDFEAAQALWQDARLLEAAARTTDEPRLFAIGLIEGRHWSAVFVHRRGKVRLISVRRARKEEIERYEST